MTLALCGLNKLMAFIVAKRLNINKRPQLSFTCILLVNDKIMVINIKIRS